MRDKLIELIQNAVGGCARHWAEIIADHLLAEGVIVLPCKAGDTVYHVYKHRDYGKIFESKVVSVEYFENDDIYLHVLHYNGYTEPIPSTKYLGKEVFLTREEAEKALAERSENGT